MRKQFLFFLLSFLFLFGASALETVSFVEDSQPQLSYKAAAKSSAMIFESSGYSRQPQTVEKKSLHFDLIPALAFKFEVDAHSIAVKDFKPIGVVTNIRLPLTRAPPAIPS